MLIHNDELKDKLYSIQSEKLKFEKEMRMKMTEAEKDLFRYLRKQVADYIAEYLKEDFGHKSYEGTWEVLASFPSYFEDETATASPDFYRVTLHCYVLGPHRHYDWDGKSFMEALNKCKRDIDSWISEDQMEQV